MRLLYLDVDGVLNRHNPHPSGYCGLDYECVQHLCSILVRIPDLRIVLSSAWRYIVHGGDVSLRGFEYIMLIFGADYDAINAKIIGVTETDEEACERVGLSMPGASLDYEWLKEYGHDLRVMQIEDCVLALGATEYVILDDLPLDTLRLVQTEPCTGLTAELADEVVRRFSYSS